MGCLLFEGEYLARRGVGCLRGSTTLGIVAGLDAGLIVGWEAGPAAGKGQKLLE